MLRALFLLKVRADAVQVVRQDSESDVAFVILFSFVGAAVESVVFQGVDVAFDGTVGVGKFTPLFAALTFAVGLAEFAFFGHDDGGNFQF